MRPEQARREYLGLCLLGEARDLSDRLEGCGIMDRDSCLYRLPRSNAVCERLRTFEASPSEARWPRLMPQLRIRPRVFPRRTPLLLRSMLLDMAHGMQPVLRMGLSSDLESEAKDLARDRAEKFDGWRWKTKCEKKIDEYESKVRRIGHIRGFWLRPGVISDGRLTACRLEHDEAQGIGVVVTCGGTRFCSIR